mgnify:CR=1 FL=1
MQGLRPELSPVKVDALDLNAIEVVIYSQSTSMD